LLRIIRRRIIAEFGRTQESFGYCVGRGRRKGAGISHIGTIRTQDVIDLADHARSAGAEAVSMIPPYYYSFSMDEIMDYYLDVIYATKDIPVIIYNIPRFTGVSFSKFNAKRLLDNERVGGIKHTCTDMFALERMRSAYPEKLFFNGLDEQFLSALSQGADATIATTMNILAPIFHKVRECFMKRDLQTAFEAQQRINDAMEVFTQINIFMGVKYLLTLRGMDCGPGRKPFAMLTDEQKTILKEKVYPLM